MLQQASEETTVGNIVRGQKLDRSAALRACYALLTLGLLEILTGVEEDPREKTTDAQAEPVECVEAVFVDESGPEPAPEPAPNDASELDSAEPNGPGDDIARANRIEQLQRDAKLHLQVKDWNGAISLLHELVAFAHPTNLLTR